MKITRSGVQWLRERAKDLSQSSVEETLLAAIATGKRAEPEELEALLYPIPANRAMDALTKLEEAGFVE